MKYSCKFTDNNGEEQVIYFEGNITFIKNDYMSSISDDSKDNESNFIFDQNYNDYSLIKDEGLPYFSDNLSINGSNYCFATIVNNKEYVFYTMDKINYKAVTINDIEEFDEENEFSMKYKITLELR